MKVETLNIRGMMKNRRVSRAFADAGVGNWLRLLGYKLAREGIRLVRIDRWYPSSQLCSGCGAINDTLTLALRDWRCKSCGAEHDRDVNAAKNMRDAPELRRESAWRARKSCGGKRRGDARKTSLRDGEARTRQLSLNLATAAPVAD